MADITLENISKSYGINQILNGVSLDIKDQEFLTLVGPSGCGKSTLLRVIAGLETPDGGTVQINGSNVTALRPSARNLAMVFQSYALYPHLSVRDNMRVPLKLRDLSVWQRLPFIGRMIATEKYRDIDAQVENAAKTLRLDALLERKPAQLSGGQKQRVALGRAMVRRPSAFLMDEPLSNLDAALRVHMRTELSELHRDLASTFVYVTHDQSEALTMSDRVAVMMGGRLAQVGTPEEIYTQPATLSVAEFLGSPKINRITPEMLAEINLFPDDNLTMPDGARHIAFRPEHLEITPSQPNNVIVRHIENLGSEFFIHAEFGTSQTRLIFKTDAPTGHHIKIGDDMGLCVNPSSVLFFDANGDRILGQHDQKRAA